jgi:hypothetical protein
MPLVSGTPHLTYLPNSAGPELRGCSFERLMESALTVSLGVRSSFSTVVPSAFSLRQTRFPGQLPGFGCRHGCCMGKPLVAGVVPPAPHISPFLDGI